MRMKIAVMARICGNICSSTSDSRPGRRPLNRIRLNAKAAEADISVDSVAATRATVSELRNQIP